MDYYNIARNQLEKIRALNAKVDELEARLLLCEPPKGLPSWATEIRAIDPVNPERGIVVYGGPNIPALTKRDAETYCQANGLGYCAVTDRVVAEIPCKPGTHEPDFDRMIDYEKPTDN